MIKARFGRILGRCRFARALLGDRAGVTAVEYAILAPVFFVLVFAIIEYGRMLWTFQAMQEAATTASRCIALQASSCTTTATPAAYTATLAQQYGAFAATAANVTVDQANTTCGTGSQSFAKVTIRVPFTSPVGSLLPGLSQTLTTSACFPIAPSS